MNWTAKSQRIAPGWSRRPMTLMLIGNKSPFKGKISKRGIFRSSWTPSAKLRTRKWTERMNLWTLSLKTRCLARKLTQSTRRLFTLSPLTTSPSQLTTNRCLSMRPQGSSLLSLAGHSIAPVESRRDPRKGRVSRLPTGIAIYLETSSLWCELHRIQ